MEQSVRVMPIAGLRAVDPPVVVFFIGISSSPHLPVLAPDPAFHAVSERVDGAKEFLAVLMSVFPALIGQLAQLVGHPANKCCASVVSPFSGLESLLGVRGDACFVSRVSIARTSHKW